MYEQLDIFAFIKYGNDLAGEKRERLKVGDKVGRVILGEVETGTIYKVEGNKKYFFYRTNAGCFDHKDARTDFEQMEKEAKENREKYKTIEIDKLDKFFAVEYQPRKSSDYIDCAIVGTYHGMLFWKDTITYQFLEPVKNLEKAYKEKVFDFTHDRISKKEMEYKVLDKIPIQIKRLYYSNTGKCYSEARYVQYNP